MDPGSASKFDLSYFKLVLKRKGLFQSDAALTTSATTKSYINQLVQGSLSQFCRIWCSHGENGQD
ncbi:hypothetical protein RND71_018470 [Anisodus tanguticus]|uniref:Plant heme peroxidase family profile domain-containing protein n=1 Tax=Anisodus tanguticus TaxID=243964 RepID=A0AAE1S5F8_9SOLA|nr:hypothetical protein RND71_018470 [Anisodus tanguticus]